MNVPTVTFDSNVWENIVDESKRREKEKYGKLYVLIASKSLIPFFFEGIATMESIPRKDRKDYISNYKATTSFQVGDEEPHVIKGSESPELTDYLKKNIPKALELGFRFLKFHRIGAVGLNVGDQYLAKDEAYTLEERIERSFECAKVIESLGAGKSRLHSRLNGGNHKGIVHQTDSDKSLSVKQYGKDFGEWVDGDALAAHYGYGIDFFCTNDLARGFGTSSIFSSNNLKKLKEKFKIKVVSPSELLKVLETGR